MLTKFRFSHLALILLLISFTQEALARAGGGGGGGGGRGGSEAGGIIQAIGLIISLCVSLVLMIKRRIAIQKADRVLKIAYLTDRTWNLDLFRSITTHTFHAYQNAWSQKNLHSIQNLLHVDYFNEAAETMNMQLTGKTNVIKDIKILDVNLVAARDLSGRDGDLFVVEIKAKMVDYTVSNLDGSLVESACVRRNFELNYLYRKRYLVTQVPFTEYWAFIRVNETWLLFKVLQKLPADVDLTEVKDSEIRAGVEAHKSSLAARKAG